MATTTKKTKEARLTLRMEEKLKRRIAKKSTNGKTLSQVAIEAILKGLALMEAEESTTQPA